MNNFRFLKKRQISKMTLVHRTSMTQALCPNNIFPFLNNSSLQIISLLGIQRSTGVVIRPNLSRPCDAWGLGNHRGLNILLLRERWSSNHNYIYIYIYKLTERIVVLLNAILFNHSYHSHNGLSYLTILSFLVFSCFITTYSFLFLHFRAALLKNNGKKRGQCPLLATPP